MHHIGIIQEFDSQIHDIKKDYNIDIPINLKLLFPLSRYDFRIKIYEVLCNKGVHYPYEKSTYKF